MFGLTSHDLERARTLAWVDFKRKYHESTLGYIWSILTPILMLGILYVIFSVFMDFHVENYQLFLLLGVIIFNFFSESTRDAMHSITQKKDLVKKINFPRKIIVVSSIFTSATYLFINFIVFFLFMVGFGIFPGATVWYLLITFLELFLLVFGLGFGLSTLYIRHGDMDYIWDFVITILFWVTPIFYDYDLVNPAFVKYYMLNPLARIISTARGVLIYNHIPLFHGPSGWKHEVITMAICIVIFIWGIKSFKKREARFAEML